MADLDTLDLGLGLSQARSLWVRGPNRCKPAGTEVCIPDVAHNNPMPTHWPPPF